MKNEKKTYLEQIFFVREVSTELKFSLCDASVVIGTSTPSIVS
jgi:hypothetical protein